MDDFSFGNVWGSDTPKPLPESSTSTKLGFPPPPTITAQNPTFDDFDDFDDGFTQPVATKDTFGDEFGDFGDFGGQVTTMPSFEVDDGGFGHDPFGAQPSTQREWKPLQLHPLPGMEELSEAVYDIIEPLFDDIDIENLTTQEPMRQVEGPGQILVTAER